MSDNNTEAGCVSILLLGSAAAAWGGSGLAAWNFIEPESFGGASLFLIAWGIFGYIAQLLFGAIAMFLMEILFSNK